MSLKSKLTNGAVILSTLGALLVSTPQGQDAIRDVGRRSIERNLLPSFEEFYEQDQGYRLENQEQESSLNRPAIASYVANHEGLRSGVYCAQSPRERNRERFVEPTIGIGHYMDRGDSRETFAQVLPEVNWEDVYNGKRELTRKEIKALFVHDLEKYISRAKDSFPEFGDYPLQVQKAIVDGFYRGCLAGSPRTKQHIRDGDFKQASKEYLNHNEYRNARQNGMRGVERRMNANSEAFANYIPQGS